MYLIERATQAVINLLEQEGVLSDDVIEIADKVLLDVWHIQHQQLRTRIIQDAAVQVGLLKEEDID